MGSYCRRGGARSEEQGGRAGHRAPRRPGGQLVRRFQPGGNQEEVDTDEAERADHRELSQSTSEYFAALLIRHWPQTESLTSELISPSNPPEPLPPPRRPAANAQTGSDLQDRKCRDTGGETGNGSKRSGREQVWMFGSVSMTERCSPAHNRPSCYEDGSRGKKRVCVCVTSRQKETMTVQVFTLCSALR